jgi:SCY1-like protein 1
MGNSASALPYSIGKQVSFVNHGWELHEGHRKSDNAPVSVFLAKKPSLRKTPINPQRNPNMTQLECAIHHFGMSKKLRHPHILQVYATLDTDNPNEAAASANNPTGIGNPQNTTSATTAASANGDLIIVTEPCMALDSWLQQQPRPDPEQIAWGLECIVRGLHFLHASANLSHGNLSPDSFFVTPAGDVKVWNFAIACSITPVVPRHFIDWENLVTPQPYRSPERIEGRWDAIAASGTHCLDSYGIGVLIDAMFGGHIPTPLVKAVQRLQTPNLKMRPRLQPLLKCPVFDTPYQKLQLQLEEFAVQNVEQKMSFFQNLTPNLQAQVIPPTVAMYKLLPLIKSEVETICTNDSLKTQEAFRKQVLSMLHPLFYIAEHILDSHTVGAQLGKVLGILFRVNDRAIRGTLLQKAPFMSENFDKHTLNEDVFEPMCSGFADSSAALRELTLKSTAALVPHLTHPNLEKLSRYLVRLQGDPEPSIRTNTVIFFSKLAPHLTETTRQKMLLPAYVRAMKDPFTPCRLAALKSTLQSKEFFDPIGIASRVLPAVTPQLLDSSAEVRREAFMAVEDLLFVLRQESERLNKLPEPVEMMNTTAPAAVAPAPASGSSIPLSRGGGAPPAKIAEAPKSGGGGFSITSGLTSWITSSTKAAAAPEPVRPQQPPTPQQQPPPPRMMTTAATSTRPMTMAPPNTAMNNMHLQNNNVDDEWGDEDGEDGWGDDDLDVSTGAMKIPTVAAPAPPPLRASSLFAAAPPDEDDFLGSFDSKPAKPVTTIRSMSGSSGGKLVIPSKTKTAAVVKPAVTKLSVKEDVSDGWDDF